jgi:Xaa-Pro aminopeptidase
MDNYFSDEFFTCNRARLRELIIDTVPIVITANGLLQKSGDAAFPFQQDTSFWYLTGIDEADLTLVMDGDKEYLIVPAASDYHDIFDGCLNAEVLRKRSGITTILDAKAGWEKLEGCLRKVKCAATLSANPDFIEVYGMYANPARSVLIQKIKDINPRLKLLDIRPHLSRLRMIKQPLELKAMQQAIDLTIGAIKRVETKLPKLAYEFEVEAEITGHFLRHGATDAWRPIVASGENACTLHYHDNQSKLMASSLITIDIGAKVDHYCADITRTLSVDGHPSRRAKAVYMAVLKAQNFAISLQKPGALISENEKLTESFLGECLRELGLIKTVDSKSVRQYFPHATSHFLGLDPHDVGDYERPLEPGVVLTVSQEYIYQKKG